MSKNAQVRLPPEVVERINLIGKERLAELLVSVTPNAELTGEFAEPGRPKETGLVTNAGLQAAVMAQSQVVLREVNERLGLFEARLRDVLFEFERLNSNSDYWRQQEDEARNRKVRNTRFVAAVTVLFLLVSFAVSLYVGLLRV